MHTRDPWRVFRFCILAAVLTLTVVVKAQEQRQNLLQGSNAAEMQSRSTIRVSTNLVAVPVSVTDAAGHIVTGLDKADFQIVEDETPESIEKLTEAGQSPLQIAILFDLSGSVHHRFGFEQQAALRFLQKIWKAGDAVSIVVFGEEPVVQLRNSRSLEEALRNLGSLQPSESATAFFDAVTLSAKLLRSSATPEVRQADIVLSDGEDNRSDCTVTDALSEVQHSDMIFYSINPGGNTIRLNEISLKGQQDLLALANQSGGSAFVSDDSSNLDEIFGKIAAELRSQYLLSYYSSNPRMDGKYRRIAVSLPQMPQLQIRSRRGYYANNR